MTLSFNYVTLPLDSRTRGWCKQDMKLRMQFSFFILGGSTISEFTSNWLRHQQTTGGRCSPKIICNLLDPSYFLLSSWWLNLLLRLSTGGRKNGPWLIQIAPDNVFVWAGTPCQFVDRKKVMFCFKDDFLMKDLSTFFFFFYRLKSMMSMRSSCNSKHINIISRLTTNIPLKGNYSNSFHSVLDSVVRLFCFFFQYWHVKYTLRGNVLMWFS